MTYAIAADLQARYPERDLAQITDEAGETVDSVKLDRALADASDRIDGYLEGRYPLPFAVPPKALKLLACDMAMYQLQQLRPLQDVEDARKRYDDAIRFLERVAKGDVTLGLATDNTVVVPNAPAVLESPGSGRIFSREELEGL